MILLDIAVLTWRGLDAASLSRLARSEIARAERVAISSISIWEMALKVKKNKLDLHMSPAEFVARCSRIENGMIFPVTETVWLTSVDLAWDHADSADRVIVATAHLNNSQLISSDEKIRHFYSRTLW